MAEDEAIFDPSLKKKKKKKKTPFDLDAALAGDAGEAENEAPAPTLQETEDIPIKTADTNIDDFNFDDDLGGLKKKKKKKKVFEMSELDDALPEKGEDGGEKVEDSGGVPEEDDLDLTLPFKKKKKKKVVHLDDVDKQNTDEVDEGKSEGTAWADTDRDYTYEELLKRVFNIMLEKNPDMVAGERKQFKMKVPRVMRVGTKKTSFSNFKDICKVLHRQPEHLLAFLLAELGTSGSIDGNDCLIIKGRFQQKQIESVLRSYIKEYVTCHTCKSGETLLQKDTRLYFLQCETCGSRCSVTGIKSGFQALTGKRAALRAKKA